jgi:hypothetical protein
VAVRSELDMAQLERVAADAAARRRSTVTEHRLFEAFYDTRRAYLVQPSVNRAALLEAVLRYERFIRDGQDCAGFRD